MINFRHNTKLSSKSCYIKLHKNPPLQ